MQDMKKITVQQCPLPVNNQKETYVQSTYINPNP